MIAMVLFDRQYLLLKLGDSVVQFHDLSVFELIHNKLDNMGKKVCTVGNVSIILHT